MSSIRPNNSFIIFDISVYLTKAFNFISTKESVSLGRHIEGVK